MMGRLRHHVFQRAYEHVEKRSIKNLRKQKDVYLYYFLELYPGRTIIFTNSIDCVRRLANFLAVRIVGGSLQKGSSP
jgi:superfamily II DNA/RNA helicase